MRTVDKLDKIGSEKVRTLLTSECGLAEEQAEEILKFIAISGSNSEVLNALEATGAAAKSLTRALTSWAPWCGIWRVRRPGGELRRGSDHRPGLGLLHRHRV